MSLGAAKRPGNDVVEVESDGMLFSFRQLDMVAVNDISDSFPLIFNDQANQNPQ